METKDKITITLSILSFTLSIIALFINIKRTRKADRISLINQIDDPFLLKEFPKELLLLQKHINKMNIENTIKVLSKEKTKINFLKFYDKRKYDKVNKVYIKLEEKIYNLNQSSNTLKDHSEIEDLVKKLTKLIYK